MVTDFLTRMAQGCLAEELDSRITQEVFTLLPTNPSLEQWERAKLALQDLYHSYRKKNPCQASAFAELHCCIYQVYCEAYDRLNCLTVQPSPPQRKPSLLPPSPAPSQEQVLNSLQSLITGTPIGRVIDDDPFAE